MPVAATQSVVQIQTLLTSAVVAAVIGCLSSVIVTLINKHSEKKTYRYKKLHEYYEKLESFHGFIDTTTDDSILNYSKLVEIWALCDLAIPLMEKNVSKPIEEALSNYLKNRDGTPANDSTWFCYVYDAFKEALPKQISKLL